VYIEEIDVVDGTPLLDIKPYVPTFDARSTDRIGWFTARIDQVYTTRADDRFRSGRSTDTV
jgi:tRNA (Thr-GGU) A37 N-methylase